MGTTGKKKQATARRSTLVLGLNKTPRTQLISSPCHSDTTEFFDAYSCHEDMPSTHGRCPLRSSLAKAKSRVRGSVSFKMGGKVVEAEVLPAVMEPDQVMQSSTYGISKLTTKSACCLLHLHLLLASWDTEGRGPRSRTDWIDWYTYDSNQSCLDVHSCGNCFETRYYCFFPVAVVFFTVFMTIYSSI